MKHISLIITVLIASLFLFSACSVDTDNEEEKLAKIKLLQEQKAQAANTESETTTTDESKDSGDSETESESEDSSDSQDSQSSSSTSDSENDEIYYYGWILYETGEHSQTTSNEYIATYSTLYRVTAKLIDQGSEDWLYFKQIVAIDTGSYQNYQENPCQAGQTYVKSEETRSASDTLYFENPEDFFTETYMGYINQNTGEYQLNLRPKITGTKTTTYNTVLYEYYDESDGAVLREDAPNDESEYSCIFGEDSSSKDYTVPDITIGSNSDPEACATLTLDDEYITDSSNCQYFTETGDLIGSFYDSLDLSDSELSSYDVETEWVSIEWNLKSKDCGTDCDVETEDDLYSWNQFDLEKSPLLEGEVEWLWE